MHTTWVSVVNLAVVSPFTRLNVVICDDLTPNVNLNSVRCDRTRQTLYCDKRMHVQCSDDASNEYDIYPPCTRPWSTIKYERDEVRLCFITSYGEKLESIGIKYFNQFEVDSRTLRSCVRFQSMYSLHSIIFSYCILRYLLNFINLAWFLFCFYIILNKL